MYSGCVKRKVALHKYKEYRLRIFVLGDFKTTCKTVWHNVPMAPKITWGKSQIQLGRLNLGNVCLKRWGGLLCQYLIFAPVSLL